MLGNFKLTHCFSGGCLLTVDRGDGKVSILVSDDVRGDQHRVETSDSSFLSLCEVLILFLSDKQLIQEGSFMFQSLGFYQSAKENVVELSILGSNYVIFKDSLLKFCTLAKIFVSQENLRTL